MSKPPTLIWPGTGEPMVYDPLGYGSGSWKCGSWRAPGRVAGLSADGHSFTAGFTWLSHEGRDPTQADVDALFKRLCDHHTAVAHSIGRGDDISMANHEACCDEAGRQRYEQGRCDMLAACLRALRRKRDFMGALGRGASRHGHDALCVSTELERGRLSDLVIDLVEELKP